MGFLISREPLDFLKSKASHENVDIVTVHTVPNEILVLLKKKQQPDLTSYINISNDFDKINWFHPLQSSIKAEKTIVLYAEKDSSNGILGFVNCLRKEPGGDKVKCVFVQDVNAPRFTPNDKFYKNVLRKGLAFNVYRDETWGTYRHVKLENTFGKTGNYGLIDKTIKRVVASLLCLKAQSYREIGNHAEEEIIRVSSRVTCCVVNV